MSHEFPSFLYCIELIGVPAAKIGCAVNPWSRLYSLRNQAPFDSRFRQVLRFQSRRLADAAESYILANADRYKARGEWVSRNGRLDRLFSEVGGDDCTAEFRDDHKIGRLAPPKEESAKRLHKAKLIDKVGPHLACVVSYTGAPAEYQHALIKARLRQGYGVEDMLAMDGIPLEDSRAVIASLKEQGVLRQVMGLNPQPTARAS